MKSLIAAIVLIGCMFATEAQACGLPGKPIAKCLAAVRRVQPIQRALRLVRVARPGIVIPKR